jgi:hypothetical protein
VGDRIEKKCPLCGVARPKGVKRCICNYTFEYERESGPFRRVASGAGEGSSTGSIVLALAIGAGIAALFYMRTLKLDPEQSNIGFLLVPAGIFAVLGGLMDWNFFMSNRRARKFVWLFGRGGARFFYGILGGGLAGAGTALLLA